MSDMRCFLLLMLRPNGLLAVVELSNVCLQALSAEGAARIAMDAAGAASVSQQTALAAFEYGLHAEQSAVVQPGRPHATFGAAESNDDMEQ
jgi:hypothetical protein